MNLVDWAPGAVEESLVWTGQPRRRVVLWGVVAGAVLAAVVALAAVRLWTEGSTIVSVLAAALVAVLAFAVPAAGVWLWRHHTRYVLTDAALYHRTGVFRIRVTELPLTEVQNTSYSQGVFGTLFDHGTVSVDTAGSDGAELRLVSLDDPDEVHGLLAGRTAGSGERVAVPGTVDQWRAVLDEVRSVRAVLDGE